MGGTGTSGEGGAGACVYEQATSGLCAGGSCGSDEGVAMGVGAGADGVGRVGGCEA